MTALLFIIVAGVCLLLALVPALLFLANARLYAVPPAPPSAEPLASLSLLIPARNEESAIADCLAAALASEGIELEVIVIDDGSTDRTAERVAEYAKRDNRVRLSTAPALPAGWCGKQHACWTAASLAMHDVLAFIDVDVRVEPAGLARAARFLATSNASLVSGVPRQLMPTPMEALLIPLIHFVLLGYLPIARMRRSSLPAFGAGCGQLFLTTRSAYHRAGGHAAICGSLHDGIMLPRAYRRAGLMTDLFDATPVAQCRMYDGAGAVWRGLAKNAVEAMASPAAIGPWTVVLLGGQVLPIFLLLALPLISLSTRARAAVASMLLIAVAASAAVRFVMAIRYRQSIASALVHPLGVAVLVAIQWWALLRRLAGRPSRWRGRAYPPRA